MNNVQFSVININFYVLSFLLLILTIIIITIYKFSCSFGSSVMACYRINPLACTEFCAWKLCSAAPTFVPRRCFIRIASTFHSFQYISRCRFNMGGNSNGTDDFAVSCLFHHKFGWITSRRVGVYSCFPNGCLEMGTLNILLKWLWSWWSSTNVYKCPSHVRAHSWCFFQLRCRGP